MVEIWAKYNDGEPVFIEAGPKLYIAQLKELVKEKLSLSVQLPDFSLKYQGNLLGVGERVEKVDATSPENPLIVVILSKPGVGTEPVNLITATIEKLDSVCSSNSIISIDAKYLDSYKRSCAAEIGRRLYHTMAVRTINGLARLPIPNLGAKTMDLMKEEGYEVNHLLNE